MNRQNRTELEKAAKLIENAATIIEDMRDEEMDKHPYKTSFSIDLDQVVDDLKNITNGVNYILEQDY